MKMIIPYIVMMMIFLVAPSLMAIQEPTQQFNKIFLDPFYRQSMNQDDPYTYTITINPPDRIRDVQSAIVTFQMWLNPTIEFFLEVNGQTCNTPSYEVHTTYAGAGEGTIFFDCSNIITHAGDYEVILTPDDDTGAVTGWVDLTYMNDPKGEVLVHGTEYNPNQDGKVFLQLLDESSQPIDNSTCFTSIYYPDNTVWKYQQLMSYLDEGLYVYDFTTPYQAGVFPVSAFCTSPEVQFDVSKYVSDWFESGNGSGGYGWSDHWDLDACSVDSTYAQDGTYSLHCVDDQDPFRAISSNTSYALINYDFWYRATDFESAEYVYVNLEDASAVEHRMVSITDGQDDGVWRRITGTFSTANDAFDFDGQIKFEIDSSGNLEGSDYYQIDTINLSLSSALNINESEYQIMRGSGEVHVTPSDDEEDVSDEYIAEIDHGTLTNETFDGYFYLYYNIISLTNQFKSGQKVQLPIFNAFPCEEVQNVYQKNESGSWNTINYSKQLLGNRNDRCAINLEMDLDNGETYEIYILLTNYWRLELAGEHEKATINKKVIYDGCVYYQMYNNLSNFIIPLLEKPSETDEFWLSCQYYFQAYYDFNKTIVENFVLDVGGEVNYTEEQMGELEGIYINLLQESRLLEHLANGILNVWQQGNDYSHTILGGGSQLEYLTLFANVSANQQNYYEILKINQSAVSDINYSLVAESIWQYNDTINPNLLSQFVNVIWSYTGSIASAITNAISDTIWSATDRNLSFYPNTSTEINVTEIWEYDNRTLSGEESLWVGGTEYSPDEPTGKVVVRIVGTDKEPVLNANCTLYIFYPNNTEYIFGQQMTEANGSVDVGGIYYADFNHSGYIGVHPYGVNCVDSSNKEYFLLDTYHVYGANYTAQAESVWGYENRTLTQNLTFNPNITINNTINFNPNITVNNSLNITVNSTINFNPNITVNNSINISVNTTDLTNYTLVIELITQYGNNLTSEQIWNFHTKNLTYYPSVTVNGSVNINATEVAEQVWDWSGDVNDNILNKIADRVQCYIERLFEDEDEWGVDIKVC